MAGSMLMMGVGLERLTALVTAAIPLSDSQIDVEFFASAIDTSWQLFRNGSSVGSPTSGTIFHDSGLTAQTTYSYTIQGVQSGLFSTAVSATTLASPVPGPFIPGGNP